MSERDILYQNITFCIKTYYFVSERDILYQNVTFCIKACHFVSKRDILYQTCHFVAHNTSFCVNSRHLVLCPVKPLHVLRVILDTEYDVLFQIESLDGAHIQLSTFRLD